MKEKKLSVLFAIVLVLALAAAGCGKKATPENLLEDVGKNLAKVESVSGDMNMSFSVSLNGETVGTGMELSLEATADPRATHMSGPVAMQMSGEEYQADVELYAVEMDGELATYSGMSGAWSRSTQEMSKDVMNTSTYEKLAESADSFKLSEDLAEVNGQECFELKGNVEGELLEELMGEELMAANDGKTDLPTEDQIEGASLPCTILIYRDTILPAKISIDMDDIMQETYASFGDSAEAEGSVEITYSEYDKVEEIRVPDQVLNAVGEPAKAEGDDDKEKEQEQSAKKSDTKAAAGLGDNWDSYTVQINGKVLSLPFDYSELEGLGFVLDESITPKDFIVNPGESKYTSLVTSDQEYLTVELFNDSGEACEVTRCKVGSIGTDAYSDGGSVDVVFPGGIKAGDSKEKVLEVYGEPTDQYEDENFHMYTWYDKNGSYTDRCQVDFDAEEGKAMFLTLSCHN